MYRLLPVVAAFALTSCAAPTTSVDRSSLASGLSAQEALALPPPGGPSVAGVVERRYTNAIQQEIALTTDSSVPGQNFLRVQFFGPVNTSAESALPVRALSEASIAREIRQALPGIPMSRSPVYVQNSYGPFGYAVGRRGDDLCLFAWQNLSNFGHGAPFSNVGRLHMRLRLCQTGATEGGLLSVMYGYTINAALSSGVWNPYGPPPQPDARLGATGQPIYPEGAGGLFTVVDPLPPPAPRRVVARPAEVTETPPVPAAPPPGAPVVPPPPNSGAATPPPAVPQPPQE